MVKRTERTTGWRLRTAALVVVLAFGLTGCKSQVPSDEETTPPEGETTEQPTTGDPNSLTAILPSSVNTQVTTNLNLATNAASAWQADAALVYASVELPASLAPDTGNEVYVFGSTADRANWWTYSISQESGKFVRAIIPKEDFLGASLDPVNTSYWNMNYVEALQLAEANGGSEFRTTNAGSHVTIFLSQRAPRGWLWWTVEYTAPSSEQFTLLVNPNRGEVVNESGDEVAPAQDTTSTDTTSPPSGNVEASPTN